MGERKGGDNVVPEGITEKRELQLPLQASSKKGRRKSHKKVEKADGRTCKSKERGIISAGHDDGKVITWTIG